VRNAKTGGGEAAKSGGTRKGGCVMLLVRKCRSARSGGKNTLSTTAKCDEEGLTLKSIN